MLCSVLKTRAFQNHLLIAWHVTKPISLVRGFFADHARFKLQVLSARAAWRNSADRNRSWNRSLVPWKAAGKVNL